jgi:chromosome partitioning protein
MKDAGQFAAYLRRVKITTVVNQKGGVGKTTTAVNLTACLAERGVRCLLVDLDPQGNATSGLGVEKHSLPRSIYDVLLREVPAAEVIRRQVIPNLDLIPANLDLSGAEVELVSAMSREFRLRQALSELAPRYDWICIDSPPSLGLLTLNGLAAANRTLVPIQCEYYALEGIAQLWKTLGLVRKHLNPGLSTAGVLLTLYDPRTNLSQQVAEEVRRHFHEQVYQTVIPRNIRLSEAPSHGQPIHRYDPQCRGAVAYAGLAEEVIAREGLATVAAPSGDASEQPAGPLLSTS